VREIFKSESGCYILLKVICHSNNAMKEKLYRRIIETIMKDIIKLSKATHSSSNHLI